MPKVYSWRFSVRTYELDVHAVVRLSALQNYMEEAATQASTSNGFGYYWYREHQRGWVARNITVRYYEPAIYGEELEMQTWVSDFRRVQSHREYDLRRVRDGARVLRGRCNWVYLDTASKRPIRLPEDFATAFEPDEAFEALDTGITQPAKVENPVIYAEERTAQEAELDSYQHVNNAQYTTWIEQALSNSLRALGWSAERLAADEVTMVPLSHEIEYLRSAVAGDCVRVETRLAQVGQDRAAWQTEIRNVATGDLLVTDRAVRAFKDSHGPRSIPDGLYLALIGRG